MHISKYFALVSLLSATMCSSHPAAAQARGGAAQDATPKWKATYQRHIINAKGERFEGSAANPVRLQAPDLSISAPLVVADNAAKTIVGRNGVQLNLGREAGDGLYIEAKSQTATLNLVPVNERRTLTLTGNISGFYRSNGARNTLSGNRAVISFGRSSGDVHVDVEGGAGGVRLEFSGLGAGDDSAPIIVTARNAAIDQKSGVARLTGNAHAISQPAEGALQAQNSFDIAAANFVINTVEVADADNPKIRRRRFDSLRSEGRTTLKLTLPPDDTNTPADNAQNATAADNNDSNGGLSLRPTYLEAAADGVTLTQPKTPAPNQRRVVTMEGNVAGFYRVAAPKPKPGAVLTAAQTQAQTERANQRFQFSGDKATITGTTRPRRSDDPVPPAPAEASKTVTDIEFEFSGRPVTTELPGFDLGFGGDDSDAQSSALSSQ